MLSKAFWTWESIYTTCEYTVLSYPQSHLGSLPISIGKQSRKQNKNETTTKKTGSGAIQATLPASLSLGLYDPAKSMIFEVSVATRNAVPRL